MNRIYKILPNFLQNTAIVIYNIISYQKRYGGNYKKYIKKFEENKSLPKNKLEKLQLEYLNKIITHAYENSKYYKERIISIVPFKSINELIEIPISTKEDIRSNINDIYTIKKKYGVVSKTGGTTGKSLEVIFSLDNIQEQFAMLDCFRKQFGYKLGKKTAWFSGKSLINKSDFYKNRFWKTDYWHNVRYYSTFHIKKENLDYYLNNLIKYKPLFLVGFPSSILEIAKFGINSNQKFPKGIIKAIFPTAETISKESRNIIENYFNSKVYNQYASSEGAPFISECKNGKLHLELQSGVFEVLDDDDMPTNNGRLIVTSFATYGTPLIRYDIGDVIELSDENCNCGNNNPLAKQIIGRIDEYVYSPEKGKINLGNITNTLKEIKGVIKFQVIQNELNILIINMIIDKLIFTNYYQNLFIKNWKDRVGGNMKIKLNFVDEIPNEKSGKYRLVLNNIKNLILE